MHIYECFEIYSDILTYMMFVIVLIHAYTRLYALFQLISMNITVFIHTFIFAFVFVFIYVLDLRLFHLFVFYCNCCVCKAAAWILIVWMVLDPLDICTAMTSSHVICALTWQVSLTIPWVNRHPNHVAVAKLPGVAVLRRHCPASIAPKALTHACSPLTFTGATVNGWPTELAGLAMLGEHR